MISVKVALSDLKENLELNLVGVINAFSRVCGLDTQDNINAEAAAIQILASRLRPYNEAETAVLRKFILQVLSSPKRLTTSSPVKQILNKCICQTAGCFNQLIGTPHIIPLTLLKDEQKERSAFILEWFIQSGRSRQLEFVSYLCEILNIEEPVKTKKCVSNKGDAQVENAGAIFSANFISLSLGQNNADVANVILASFDKILNTCWNSSLIPVRKMVIKITESWARCFDVEIAARLLLTSAIEECDASIRCIALDALSAPHILDFLSPAQFCGVFSAIVTHHTEKLLQTVSEKSFGCLEQIVSRNPFKSLLNECADAESVPDEALEFNTLAETTLDEPSGVTIANRLSGRILKHCVAILSETFVPSGALIHPLLGSYTSAVMQQPRSSLSAINVMASILLNKIDSVSALISLTKSIIIQENIRQPIDLEADDISSFMSGSPLLLLINRLIKPKFREALCFYIDSRIDVLRGDDQVNDIDAVLFCIGAIDNSLSSTFSALFIEVGNEFLLTCIRHLEQLALRAITRSEDGLPTPNNPMGCDGHESDNSLACNQERRVAEREVETIRRILFVLVAVIPLTPDAQFVCRHLKQSFLFSPGAISSHLLSIDRLQVPFVKLGNLLPNPQRTIFELFATVFEEAFNDRDDFEGGRPIRILKVSGVLSALGVICRDNAKSITSRISHKWDLKLDVNEKKIDAVDVDGGDGSYLKDLIAQQQQETEICNALEASVMSDGGFLACYITLIEDLAQDPLAPTSVRVTALKTIGDYCACSSKLAHRWAPQLLTLGVSFLNSSELRCMALRVWGRLGPQNPGEELVLLTFIRQRFDTQTEIKLHGSTCESKTITTNEEAHDELEENQTYIVESKEIPDRVRITAMHVLYKLIRAEKVKGRRSLCILSESLVDGNVAVQKFAADIFQEALTEINSAGLLFEVIFSEEVHCERRVGVALALIDILKKRKLQVVLHDLCGSVAREVVHKRHAIAAVILSVLIPTPESLAVVHQALMRGMLKGTNQDILQLIRTHLLQDSISNSFSDHSNVATSVASESAIGKSQKKPRKSKPQDIATDAIDVVSTSRLMIDDLLRTEGTNKKRDVHILSACEIKRQRRQIIGDSTSATIQHQFDPPNDESISSSSDFEDEPQESLKQEHKGFKSEGLIHDGVLQRFKTNRLVNKSKFEF